MAIELNPANRGLLHRKMGVKQGHKISVASLMAEEKKAKRAGDVKIEREAIFALNSKRWGGHAA